MAFCACRLFILRRKNSLQIAYWAFPLVTVITIFIVLLAVLLKVRAIVCALCASILCVCLRHNMQEYSKHHHYRGHKTKLVHLLASFNFQGVKEEELAW